MGEFDIAVIGGGCIGCSVAKHLAEEANLDVCIIEKEYHLAEHQSGRNSGVLHPGFNYEPGSMKAKFSTDGTRRMKEYCREHDIPLDECGVLVGASSDRDRQNLERLERNAAENGVEAEMLDSREEIESHEPAAACETAMYCPEAASVDSQKYVYTLAKEAETLGVEFFLGYEAKRFDRTNDGHRIETSKGAIDATYVVNAAGLYADRLAHRMGIGESYKIVPFRGEYYELVPGRRSLVNSMIYPTPDPELPFLGVHFTRRTDGKVIVGPNAVLAFGREAYRNTDVNVRELVETGTYAGFWRLVASRKMLGVAWEEVNKSYRKSKFVSAAQSLVPTLERDDFVRSYAGIRAQLVSASGDLVKEPVFVHGDDSTHVLNAVSPGLTCSLPFGEHIAESVLERT